jgi:hypothetical protein
MRRIPTEAEERKIAEAIFGGDRVEATSLYISITECGLTEAQVFIKGLTAAFTETHPERFIRKRRGNRNWFQIHNTLSP